MANSNFRRSHLQAMKHRIADDWKYRLSTAFNETASVSEETDSRKSLVNLLFGRDAQVKQRVDQQPDLESRMSELMRNEVLNKVIGPTPVHLREGPVTNKWFLINLDEHPRMLSILKPLLDGFIVMADRQMPKFYKTARRLKVWSSDNSQAHSHARSQDTLLVGSAIQCLGVHDNSVLVTQVAPNMSVHETEVSISYFAIESLFTIGTDSPYGAVRKCAAMNTGLLRVERTRPIQLLELTDSVRRIATVHCCHQDPWLRCIKHDEKEVDCKASLLQGNQFYYFDRENGYPTRMA